MARVFSRLVLCDTASLVTPGELTVNQCWLPGVFDSRVMAASTTKHDLEQMDALADELLRLRGASSGGALPTLDTDGSAARMTARRLLDEARCRPSSQSIVGGRAVCAAVAARAAVGVRSGPSGEPVVVCRVHECEREMY